MCGLGVLPGWTGSIVQGVEDKEASDFYLGKRIAYIYKVREPAHGVAEQTLSLFLWRLRLVSEPPHSSQTREVLSLVQLTQRRKGLSHER